MSAEERKPEVPADTVRVLVDRQAALRPEALYALDAAPATTSAPRQSITQAELALNCHVARATCGQEFEHLTAFGQIARCFIEPLQLEQRALAALWEQSCQSSGPGLLPAHD